MVFPYLLLRTSKKSLLPCSPLLSLAVAALPQRNGRGHVRALDCFALLSDCVGATCTCRFQRSRISPATNRVFTLKAQQHRQSV